MPSSQCVRADFCGRVSFRVEFCTHSLKHLPMPMKSANKSVPRWELTGFGDSLTEKEALERVGLMEEEKEKCKKADIALKSKKKRQAKNVASSKKEGWKRIYKELNCLVLFIYCLQSEKMTTRCGLSVTRASSGTMLLTLDVMNS